ncbi:MAG: NUDIX hydrolase [Flavobacteriales bacterium]|nr:NUDIX hydrolase [Flavobacteriales bacterium]
MKEKKEVLEEVIGHQFSAYYKIPIDKFFQFALSVDGVVLGYHEKGLKLLVIERGTEPHLGKMALPGDLVYPNEDLDLAAVRILKDLTGLDNVYLKQTKSYGQVDRHPIGRVITVGYYSLISVDRYQPLASSWADNVFWVDIDNLPDLAFDHNVIVSETLEILRERARQQPIGFELLPKEFTLGEMQALYEAILNEKFDKANFRKRILSMGLLKDTQRMQTDVPHRPARLYMFDKDAYESLLKKGFNFEL